MMAAWLNPFRRRTDENTRSAWGYTFQFTPDHFTPDQVQHLKYSYDVLGEECLNILNEIAPAAASVPVKGDEHTISPDSPEEKLKQKPVKPKRDLYLLLKENKDKHPKLRQLWDEVTTIPEWVDWEQIERGQDVFYRYGGPTLTGLAYQSLLGGMGANRVVEVLARTGGFGVNVARHRLFETTQHILQCTRSLDSIKPLGEGFASSIRVRLLHAAVRQRILSLAKTRPEYYDVQTNGVPINDLDSIGTIGTFSASIVWISLPRQGIFPRTQETEDYIALWRLIAHYTGTPTDVFSSPAKARAMMESLYYNEINPSETSRLLATNIIRALADKPPAYPSRGYLEINARWLNGRDLSDALGIGHPPWYYWILMTGQCLCLMALCYTYRAIPAWDRKKIDGLKKVFWFVIVEGKYGLGGEEAVFDFKYVPELGKVTKRGEDEVDSGNEKKEFEVRDGEKSLHETGRKEFNWNWEKRSLVTLTLASGLIAGVGYVSYLGVRLVGGLMGRVLQLS